MKLGTAMVSSDGGEECELTETAKSHAGMENSPVQSHEFGDNCLNGIKWPPEHYQKNSSRPCLAFNGSGRLKTTLVTHGGRTSKLPARFIESDPVEELKSKRTFVERRKKGGLSSRKVDKFRKELCKNGRSKSLKETSGEVTEHLRAGQVTGASIEKETRIIGKSLRLNLTPCLIDGCNNCVNARISTSAFPEKSVEIFRTGFGEEVPIKRKRGRPPKKKFIVCEVNGDVRNKISPHGKFVMNATKAPIASLSPSKFGVKRKRTDDVCNSRRSSSTSSSDESSVSLPSPRKRGRPPLSRSTCGGSKEDIFKTPNGVRKPWARPLLKAVEGNSLLSSPGKSLDGILASSDKCVTEMKRKLMKVNGVQIPCSDGKDVQPRRRGRPPKNSSCSPKVKKVQKDIFHFTDDEDTSDAMLSTRKMKSPSKQGKIPMGIVSFKNTGLAQQLKKKSLQKAKETLKSRMKTAKRKHSVERSSGTDLQTMPEQQPAVWDIEKVLGMKRNLAGSYEYLVQWKNGTSCWVPTHQLGDYNLEFSRFLQHSCQDLPVVHRLPFRAYWQEDLFSQPADHNLTLSSVEESGENPEEERTLEVPPICTGKPQQCKEVIVETYDNCAHIIVKRSSSKRSKVNLRIVDAVIVALEEAAEDNSDYVRISGLGEELFCGLDLNTMTNVAAKDEIRKYRRDIDHVRYLVQMIQTFPKPVVASLEKPGQGLGARLFSLCDLVCDKESLSDHASLGEMLRKGRVPYCFPRLMGHASVSERLLMGQELLGPEMSLQEKVSAVFRDSKFTKELKGTLKAMSVLPQNMKVLESVGEKSDEMPSKQEKELLEEQQKLAEECLRDIESFWQEITNPVSSRSVTVA